MSRKMVSVNLAVKDQLQQLRKSLKLPSESATLAYLISYYRMMQLDIEHWRHEILLEDAKRMNDPSIRRIEYKMTEINLLTGEVIREDEVV